MDEWVWNVVRESLRWISDLKSKMYSGWSSDFEQPQFGFTLLLSDRESSKSVPVNSRNLFASRRVCAKWRRQQGPLYWILQLIWQLLQEHGLDPSFIGVKHEEVQDSASDFKTTAWKILRGKWRQMMLWPMLGPIYEYDPEAFLMCWKRHEHSLPASCIVVTKTRQIDKKIYTFHFQARHLQHARMLARVSFGCKNTESKNMKKQFVKLFRFVQNAVISAYVGIGQY